MFLGKSCVRLTPRVRERKISSQSGTRRRWSSKLANESLLISQPRSWSLAASACCDQPFLLRHFRTCGPIRFNGAAFTGWDGNERPGNGCVHTHTILNRVAKKPLEAWQEALRESQKMQNNIL